MEFREENILQIILLLLITLAYSLSIRYSFSKLSDTIYYSFLVYLSSLAFVTLYIYVLFNTIGLFSQRFKLLYLIMLPFIYIIEVLSNYPNIWARDVYLHGQIWELDLKGFINMINYYYPKEYPGFFLTSYALYKICGFDDMRVVNVFILYPILMVALILLYYLVTIKVLKNVTISLISSLIGFNLIMFNRNELTFMHANTRLFSLVLLLLSSLLILKMLDEPPVSKFVELALAISGISLAISHPLFGLVPPLALLILFIFIVTIKGLMFRKVYLGLAAATLLTVVLLWNLYNYYNLSVSIGIRSLFQYMYHVMGIELLSISLTIREVVPSFGVLLRTYYKIIVGAFTLIGAGYVLRRIIEGKLSNREAVVASFALSLAAVFLSTVFTASLGNSIDRLLISYPLYLTILVIDALNAENFVEESWKKFLKAIKHTSVTFLKNAKTTLLLLLLLLSIMSLAHFTLVHEESVISMITQPLDNAALFILKNSKRAQHHLTVTSPFGIYYSFFDPTSSVKVVSVDLEQDIYSIAVEMASTEGIKVIDIRGIIGWSMRYNSLYKGLDEWNNVVFKELSNSNNLIYSNGIYENVFFS